MFLPKVWLCHTVVSWIILDVTEKSWLEGVCEMSVPLKGSGMQ